SKLDKTESVRLERTSIPNTKPSDFRSSGTNANPERSASFGELKKHTSFSSKEKLPVAGLPRRPNRVSNNSVLPAPINPKMPSISPLQSSNERSSSNIFSFTGCGKDK